MARMRVLRRMTALLGTGAALLAAAAEPAESTCFADAKRVCPDVHSGDPGFLACLRAHLEELSPSCEQDLRRIDRRAAEFQDACGGDVLRLCRSVPQGEGRVLACLDEAALLLSPGCAQAIAIAFEKVEVLGKACKDELLAHCAGVPRGGGRRFLCLKAKERLLSDGCRAALRL
jgi:hypothetical protein